MTTDPASSLWDSLKTLIRIVAVAALFCGLVVYAWNAHVRLRAGDCPSEKSPDGLYVGETCVLDGAGNLWLVRIYSAKDHVLLAERTVDYYMGPPSLDWGKAGVGYAIDDANAAGGIALPPTWLDWLRAKLP